MVTRRDVTRLAKATGQLSDEAVRVLTDFLASTDLGDAARVRDALLEVVPALSDVYGDAAATVAAEWYEDLRAREVGGAFNAKLGATAPTGSVQGSVRWAAAELFTDHPQTIMDVLGGAVQRHVLYAARETIARNVEFDPAKPRYAVVPTGANPCAWCTILASRGWVYSSKKTADAHSKYHDNCSCQAVPSWDAANAHIKGYDPDAAYDLYLKAYAEAGPGESLGQIANRMRTQNPGLFGPGK